MSVAGLIGTAVGATGVRSLAEALTEKRDAIAESFAFAAFQPTLPSAVAIVTSTHDVPAQPTASTAAHSADLTTSHATETLPAAYRAQAPLVVGTHATPIRPVQSTAMTPVEARKSAPAALPLPPERATLAIRDAWFGDDDGQSRPSARPLSDRGGRTIAVADANPVLDLESLADVELSSIATPRVNSAATPQGSTRGHSRQPVVLPPIDQIVDGTGTGIDSDTGLSTFDPMYGTDDTLRPSRGPVVHPPYDQVVDNGGMGMEFDPLLGAEYIPPVQPTVELPYDTIVNNGGLDLPPRHASGAGWTPGNGEFQDVIVGPDGAIIIVPEPTTLVAAAALGVTLLGRRRRS